METKTYTELILLPTFEERFDYLKLGGVVGSETFGFDRWMNQEFYRSREWKDIRREVIIRDEGFDLAHPDFPVRGQPLIHHMNPLVPEDIIHVTSNLMTPEYLITTSLRTHNEIHYGNRSHLPRIPIERHAGDTALWHKH